MTGRVIKSEEVKVVSKIGKSVSKQGCDAENGKAQSITCGSGMPDDRKSLKDSYEKKMQAAIREARERGLAQGREEGREMQKQEALQSMQALAALIGDLAELKQKMVATAEEQIMQLALAVSEKVIHMEVQTNREVVQQVLKAAMKNIVDRENMKIRVNPQDFQYMMEIKPDFIRSLDGVKKVVFEEDASIIRGGAVIETMFGEVDARLDHQYDQIKSFLSTS